MCTLSNEVSSRPTGGSVAHAVRSGSHNLTIKLQRVPHNVFGCLLLLHSYPAVPLEDMGTAVFSFQCYSASEPVRSESAVISPNQFTNAVDDNSDSTPYTCAVPFLLLRDRAGCWCGRLMDLAVPGPTLLDTLSLYKLGGVDARNQQ